MKQSSKRLLSIIIALLLVIVALVVFFDLIQPEYADILQTKGQIAAENDLYQTESQAVASAQKVLGEFQKQQGGGSSAVALALPTGEDLAGAIAQVYGLAANNNLAIQSLTLSAPTLQGTGSGAQTAATTKPLGSFSLQVNAIGTYENFKNFISGIETNIRIFDVRGATIAPASQAATGGKTIAPASQDLFNYTMTIVTYYQTD